MQSTTEKRRRSVHVIFLISIIINFALALNAYVNSTFLTGITGSKSLVSLIFTGGSILAVIGLAFIPLVLRRFGNYATTLTITVLGAVVFLGLSLLQSPVLIVLSFLVYLVVSSLLYYNIDLLLEHFSKNSTTGGMRGAFLSVSALAFLAGPFVAGFILGENEYWKIYLATAILFVLAIPVFVRSFKTYKDPVYDRTPFWKTLREIYQHQDMRKLFSIYFLLRFFYAWMIIYTPIYLNEFVGLSWTTIGIIFSIMLLPFVLLEYPLGKMADTKLGEKEIMTLGFVVLAIATATLSLITTSVWWVWAVALFATRIGASMVESMSQTYFFKKIDDGDSKLLGFFQMTSPLSYIIAPVVASVVFLFLDFRFLFIVLGILVLFGIPNSIKLRDTL